MKFEDGLSIQIMRKRQLFTNIFNSKSQCFGKSQAARPLYFKPRSFKLSRDRSRLGAPVHVRVSKLTGTYSKE
jgi:hypothetical protein